MVNQLDRGAALVDSPEERERIAELDPVTVGQQQVDDRSVDVGRRRLLQCLLNRGRGQDVVSL